MTFGRLVMRLVQGRVGGGTRATAVGGEARLCDPTEVGGEGGIRTRDGLPRTAFPVRRHSPLGDLSRGRIVRAVPSWHGARRYGGPWKGGAEHRSERTPWCVSEERRRQRS